MRTLSYKHWNSLKILVERFCYKEKMLGYLVLQMLKIDDSLFLLCSGYCLETPSIVVFFSSDQTKATMLLVLSLRKVSLL